MDAAAIWAVSGPLLGLAFMLIFRRDISAALGRLRRFRITKSGVEGDLDSLTEAATRAEESVRQLPPPIEALPPAGEPKALPAPNPASVAVRESTASDIGSKAGLVLLAAAIERALRELLASTGWHRNRRMTSLPVAFDQLAAEVPLARTQRDAVQQFWAVRNRLVHGHDASEDDVVRAYDAGLMILAMIAAIPREVNTVHHPGAQLFADAKGEREVVGARALILETTQPDGTKAMRVFPTTRTDYVKGKQVAWEWRMGTIYPESWYRDPDTGEVKYAWSSSAEFVGRQLDEIV